MLPRRYIEEWKEYAPWPEDAQVEQNLVIERTLVQLFSDSFLQERLAFRGGTALHKLFLKPQVRYSEDIDLVQIKGESIKDTLIAIRKQLEFLGKPAVKQKANNTLVYRFEAEEMLGTKLRALYQRKKGRDLFDLFHALTHLDLDKDNLIHCYREYMAFSVEKPPTRKQFILNMEEKLQDPDFEGDIYALLRPGTEYDQDKAYELVKNELIEKI